MSETKLDDPRAFASIFREVFLGRLRNFLFIAVVLILISVIIDFQYLSSHINDTVAERVAAQELPFWMRVHFYSTLMRELGFALAIALVVATLLESSARMEQNRFFRESMVDLDNQHKKNIERISQDVFSAVLRSRVPNSISDIALDILIAQRIIRKNLFLKYVLKNLPEDQDEKFKSRFIFVESSIRYNLHNISQEDVPLSVKCFIPFPADDRLNKIVNIDGVSIDGEDFSRERIDQGGANIEDSETEKKWSWPLTIPVGKSVEVSLRYTLVKERSDNDCWTSLYPTTTGGQYEVNVGVGGLEWSVDALHSGSLLPADGSPSGLRVGGSCVFNFEKGLLPYQGVLLWWRPKREPVQAVTEAGGSC